MRPSARFARLATNPRASLVLACLGFALVLPSLGAGLDPLDDYGQQGFVQGRLLGSTAFAERAWYDIYNLASGAVDWTTFCRYTWIVPWWTWPGVKVRFLRPVTAATFYLDHALFGERYWLAHLDSACWYLLACSGVTLLLKRLSKDPAVALLGAMFFVLDDAHTAPASWLAGRNAVIAVTFFAFAMMLYKSACDNDRALLAVASASCFLTALLAGESALSAVPCFVAYAIFLDRRAPLRRLVSLGVVLAAVATWLVLYRALGFGVAGSGAYLDPIADGAAYWSALPGRYLSLIHIHFGAPWPQLSILPRTWLQGVDLFETWVLVPALAVFVIRSVARDSEIAFWALFAALGLIPLTSAPPHERLLMHVGIALWMLLAHFLVAVARAADRYPKRPAIAMSAFLCVVLLIHLGLAPIALAVGSGGRVPTAARVSARILDEDPTCWSGYLVFVNVASQASVLTLLNERARERLPQPILSSALGVTDQEVEVKRLDARTLELYSRHGYLLDPFANSWRGPSVPLRRGERVGVLEYEIEVLELTSDRRPSRIRARFARVLEDPVLCFAYWNGRAFAKFPLGAFGETHIIAGASDLAGQRDAQHR